MSAMMRQPVPSVKASLSRDKLSRTGKITRMVRSRTEQEYIRRFTARLTAAREAAGFTQETMADRLGITRERYSKYEIRSLMPHWFIPAFCEATGHHPWYILTGQPPLKSPGSAIAPDRISEPA